MQYNLSILFRTNRVRVSDPDVGVIRINRQSGGIAIDR